MLLVLDGPRFVILSLILSLALSTSRLLECCVPNLGWRIYDDVRMWSDNLFCVLDLCTRCSFVIANGAGGAATAVLLSGPLVVL